MLIFYRPRGYRTHTSKNPDRFHSKVVPKTKSVLWLSFIAKAFLRTLLPNKKPPKEKQTNKQTRLYQDKFQNLDKSYESALNLA